MTYQATFSSRKRRRTYNREFTCDYCGESFRASRTDARYCSPRCCKAASRDRHEGAAALAGVKDELQALYQQLVVYRPKTARGIVACYEVHGKGAAESVLETLRMFTDEGKAQRANEPNERKAGEPNAQNKKSVLARLRGG